MSKPGSKRTAFKLRVVRTHRVITSRATFVTIITLALYWILFSSPLIAQDPSLSDSLDNRSGDESRSFEDRIRDLENFNRELREQLNSVSRPASSRTQQSSTGEGSFRSDDQESIPVGGNNTSESSLSAQTLQTQSLTEKPPTKKKKNAVTQPTFGEGFEWRTEDEEFTLQFHNETQLDMRAYAESHPDPVDQFGFYIPRMRMIFNGTLTKPIEYTVSINKGLGSLDLLDAFLNFNYDERFQVRFGRFRVPFTYDWFALSNQFLPTPERSVYAINQGYNRNVALMLHGELLDESMEYAIAAANGPRNSYFDTNAGKDVMSYVNIRPFMHDESLCALNNLNLGVSGTYGQQDQDALPTSFRTSANATESAGTVEAAPAFLQLKDSVAEHGWREQGEIHAAWYFRQLSLMAAWDSGFNDYRLTANAPKVRVRSRGYHIQMGYFLTGEEVQRRTFVEPLCPFDLRPGKFGLGAFELQSRFDHFALSDEVFKSGLADANLWTNQVNTIDSGVNWYWNKYLKVYFDWQHSIYAAPVVYRAGRTHKSSDLFWLRCQIYF